MALRSLLVIAERSGEAQAALQRASVIARHAGAKIELFTCDTDHAWALGEYARSPEARAVIDRCNAQSMRYLEALRGSISAPDVQIDVRCACAPAMLEGIAARIESLHPNLVIKSLSGSGALRAPLPVEMQIVHGCAAPLLLTHGTPWRPAPRIGAALDLTDGIWRAQAVAHFAAELAGHCAGTVYRGFAGRGLPAGAVEALDLSAAQIDLLRGAPRDALRAWVGARRLDVLVIGSSAGPQAGQISMAEQLLGELPCDIIIMPFPAPSVPPSH